MNAATLATRNVVARAIDAPISRPVGAFVGASQ
jgi:hypothetical protein